MTWRKCLVRGLVFTSLGGLVLAGGMYALWTNPTAMRQLVKEQLGGRFVQVNVQLDRAHMRLLGGILVQELRMARTDGLDSSDFLYVPSAVIYHDKEHMLEGKMSVRKVDLTGPQFRVVRDRDGKLNLAGILGPIDLSERMPTVVVRGGTVTFEDHTLTAGSALLEIRNVHMTMINDPLPTLQVEGGGDTDVLGPIQFRATVPRTTLAANIQVDLPAVQVESSLQRRAASLWPQAAAHLDQLTGLAEVHARLQIHDKGPRPYSYDVNAHFQHGRCAHPLLPSPLEEIDLEARCTDGLIPALTLSATSGGAHLQARVADFRLPADMRELDDPHHLIRELDFSVKHLVATPTLLARLPDFLQFIKEDYSPSGPFSLSYTYRQADAEGTGSSLASIEPVPMSGSGCRPLQQEWLVEPEGMAGDFIDFRYPLKDVRGKIRVDAAAPQRTITLDLSARTESRVETSHQRAADNHLITLRGSIKGEKKTPEVQLDIHGEDVELDDRILRALPARARKVALQFLPEPSRRLGLKAHPMGTGDFHAVIHRQRGKTHLDKRFTVTFKQAALQYDQFPYPLENVSGVLVIHPDHWECKNFHGGHSGGEIVVDGFSEPLPGRPALPALHGGEGPRPEIVHLRIHGKDLLLDQEFAQALSPVGGGERKALQKAWRTLALAGRMNFDAEVIDHPNHPQDIDVSVTVQGCTMKPTFFDYALNEVSGAVRYAQGQVFLRDVRARHGQGVLELPSGQIQLKPGGGFVAWMKRISGRNILPDQDLLLALPEGLRRGFQPLRLEKPLDVGVTELTLDTPPGGNAPVKVWWDGEMALNNASLQTGVEVKDATGQFSCRGHYDGQQLRGMFGDLVLKSANILGQPLSALHGRLEVMPDSPEVIRVRDFKATLFGGSIGGEARLEVGSMLHYDVLVEALGVQLDQFGRHNLGANAAKAQLQGPVRSALHLQGEGGDLGGLKGNGRLDVVQGKMGQLPVLLDLLKAFGLRMPDRTAFEEAHMVYAIEGPQVRVQQLDLYGNAVSLRGQGTVDLDGKNLNLDFTATPGRFVQVLPSVIDLIPQLISQQFLKIKMRGKLGAGGDIRFDKELVPAVVDPLRRVIGQ